MRFWNTLPLSFRRSVAHAVVREGWAAPLRAAARAVVRPMVVWVLYAANLIAWHLPPAYDATLANQAVHDLEHVTYLLFGVLLWAQLVDTAPFHSRLGLPQRVVYLGTNMFVGWALAIALAFSVTPYYAPYIRSVTLGGVIAPITDQQIAGGIMWVPGTIPFAICGFLLLYHWIERERRKDEPKTGVARAGQFVSSSDPHWT
jgi:putative membrane protein